MSGPPAARITSALHADPEHAALLALSVCEGRDPSRVQAAGGNTSIKRDGVLWIKASGTWLARAGTDDILVPVALAPLLEALGRDDPAAEKAQAFVIEAANPDGLRPSIETTVHAVMPRRIVVHVHCVDTIATAALADAEAHLAPRLAGLDWRWIPYVRPGLPLAREIVARGGPDADVLVLGNHGLVVAADTVSEAAALLEDACARLAIAPREASAVAAPVELESLAADSDYALPDDGRCHDIALDPVSLECAGGGSLYPDHVIFLGPGMTVARDGETLVEVLARRSSVAGEASDPPAAILFPGRGALVHREATPSARAMLRCLADVCSRLPSASALRYLTPDEEHALVHWEAEAYRRSLGDR